MPLKLQAYSKINLFLKVLDKRHDGYHNINTLFLRTEPFDYIEITNNKEILVECNPNLNIPIEENIAYKAAILLKNFYNINSLGCNIKITKNIPAGAGLGGGSSDAASVLRGLSKLWKINTSYNELFTLAAKLGSDVPYFLNPGTANASNKGEELSYIEFTIPYYILLVNPGINISTKWAYCQLDKNRAENSKEPVESLNSTNPAEILSAAGLDSIFTKANNEGLLLSDYFYNDFEKPVFELYPSLRKIKNDLYSYGAVFALMSGSGSTVYGLFKSLNEARHAAHIFEKYKTYISKPTTTKLTKN